MKCVTWFSQGLDCYISLLLDFFTPNLGFCILGTLVGSKSFVESFVVKAFHEDLGMISSLPMFTNTHVAFEMFSLCYVQCLSYLFRIVFPFPSIW